MAARTERERLEQLLRGQAETLDEVRLWLAEEDLRDQAIRSRVSTSRQERIVAIRGLDDRRVFHADDIRAMCLKYRLRFLDSALFKGELPLQAVRSIRELERRSEGPLTSFKVLAPASRFKLCDSEADPLLFVPVGGGRYYLVHKWGADLGWWRIVLGLPTRTPLHLAGTVVLVAALLSLVVPTALISGDPDAAFWGAHRALFMLWATMVCASFTMFGWFAFFGQFSSQAWNSRYFN